MKWFFLGILIVGLLVIMSSCESQIDYSDRVNFESIAPAVEKAIEQSDWQEYEDQISFSYSKGWYVYKKEMTDHVSYVISNTNKSIIRGAILPDDYYIYNGSDWQVNTDLYAEKFVMITVDYYPELQNDWEGVVENIYPDLVEEFENYQVPYNEDVEAISFVKQSGLIEGRERFMARTRSGIVDIAYISKLEHSYATLLQYYSFVSKFGF